MSEEDAQRDDHSNQNAESKSTKNKSWGRLTIRPSFMGEKNTIPIASPTQPLPCVTLDNINYSTTLPEDRLIFRQGIKLYIVQENCHGDALLVWGYFASDKDRQGFIPKHYIKYEDERKKLRYPQNTLHRYGSTFFTFPSSQEFSRNTLLKSNRSKSAEASLVSPVKSNENQINSKLRKSSLSPRQNKSERGNVTNQDDDSTQNKHKSNNTKVGGPTSHTDPSKLHSQGCPPPPSQNSPSKKHFKLPFSSTNITFSKNHIDSKPRSSSDSSREVKSNNPNPNPNPDTPLSLHSHSVNQSSSFEDIYSSSNDSTEISHNNQNQDTKDSDSDSTQAKGQSRFKRLFKSSHSQSSSPSSSRNSSIDSNSDTTPKPNLVTSHINVIVEEDTNDGSENITSKASPNTFEFPPETVISRANTFHNTSGELKFLKNDMIHILKQQFNNSPRIYLGYLNGVTNIFPASKVDIIGKINTTDDEVNKAYKSWPKYEGIAPHISTSPESLPFKKGDILYVKDPVHGKHNWFAVMDTSVSFSDLSGSASSASSSTGSISSITAFASGIQTLLKRNQTEGILISGLIPAHLVRPLAKQKKFKLGLKKQIPKMKGQIKFDFEQNDADEILVVAKGTIVTIEQNIVPEHPDSYIVSYTKGTEVVQGRIPQGFVSLLASKSLKSGSSKLGSSDHSSFPSTLSVGGSMSNHRQRLASMNTSDGVFGMIRNPGFFNKPSTYYGDAVDAYTQPFWEEIGQLPSLKLDNLKIIDTMESLVIDEEEPQFPRLCSYNILLYILFCDTWWTENPTLDRAQYHKIFLKTYRVFSTPTVLLQKIYQALDIPFQTFAYFNREAFQENLTTVITELAASSEFVSQPAKKLFKPILARLPKPTAKLVKRTLDQNDPLAQSRRRPTMIMQRPNLSELTSQTLKKPKTILPSSKDLSQLDGGINLFHFDPQEVARQICLVDYAIFSEIHTREFINQAWAKSDSSSSAKNVLNMIHSSTKLSLYVATTIVTHEDPQKRVKSCEYWIDVLSNLVKLNNYHSVMAVVAGFQNNATYRLKQTKALISKKRLKILENALSLTETTKNFQKLRTRCENAKPPCLPFIGMYLTDLTFLDDGNKNTLGRLINWRKCRKTWELIVTLLRLQGEAYHFLPFGEIQSLLKNLVTMTDDELYAKSLEIEPRLSHGRQRRFNVQE